MEGYLPVVFLLIVLKVPVIGMIYLLWWASKPAPDAESAGDEGDGGRPERLIPGPKFPRGPRRDPHGGGSLRPSAPSRGTRTRGPGRRPVRTPARDNAGHSAD
ncbi:MAG: hypothetical protein JJE10_09435 [Thermoleophilia bacterium]|nr:hypothetical protein [Thermoleophilia bacterium]